MTDNSNENATTVQWARLQDIFNQALELPENERVAFVERECKNDESLSQKIIRMLSDATASGDLVEIIGTVAERAGDQEQNKRFGPYKVVKEIGRGGMGVVYLAERDEQGFEQTVAIKQTPLFASEAANTRFLQERQLLAKLSHPHIAQLFDGGTNEQGFPYLVMEYIDGETIIEYCKHKSLKEKLALFLQVCDAISFAHNNLIVHQDIKPGNILVDKHGKAKVLDFGIAKLLDASQTEKKDNTQKALTPRYAAPEQIAGGDITIATDVYGLGRLLQELITDHSELKFVIKKCLVGDPQSRYLSVASLIADIKNYQHNFPLVAVPQSWLYFSRKFLVRHPLAIGFSLALFIVVSGFSASLITKNKLIQQERDSAMLERDRAQTVSDFLVNLFEDSNPDQSLNPTLSAIDVINKGVEKIRADDALDPQLKAMLQIVLAEAILGMGKPNESIALFSEGITLQRSLGDDKLLASYLLKSTEAHLTIGDYSQTIAALEEYLSLSERLGFTRFSVEKATQLNNLGFAYYSQGKYTESIRLLHESVDVWAELEGEEGVELARSINTLGRVYRVSGNLAKAQEFSLKAKNMREKLLGKNHPDYAESVNSMAVLSHNIGDYALAETYYRETMALDEKLLGPDNKYKPDMLNNIAVLLWDMGQQREAIATILQAIELRTKNEGTVSLWMATHWQNLSRFYSGVFELANAKTAASNAMSIQQELTGPTDPDIAETLYLQARIARLAGDLDTATELLEQSEHIFNQDENKKNKYYAAFLEEKGLLSMAQGNGQAALSLYQQSEGLYQKLTGENSHKVWGMRARQGEALLQTGDIEAAKNTLDTALNALTEKLGEKHFRVQELKAVLATITEIERH